MNSVFFYIAQAEVPVPDPTTGQILTRLAVLGVIAGSLLMCSVWFSRFSQGIEVIPRAGRKPLVVPIPLLVCGFGLTVLMAFLAAVGQPMDEEGGNEPPAVAEGDEAPPDDEAAALDAQQQTAKLYEMMMGNINVNLIVFAIFGTAIWLSQQHRSRRLRNLDDVGYDGYARADAEMRQQSGDVLFPDLDAPSSSPHRLSMDTIRSDETIRDLTNPYAYSSPSELVSRVGEAEVAEELKPLERWNFVTEFRFAAETFLVAYLPTTAIRIFILSLLPDAPSHPFLKILEDGVEWDIVALIFLMAVIVAPLVEELLFRVTLLGGLQQRRGFMFGWIASSVLFGLAHGFPDCIALLPLAFAMGYVYSQRRSYRTVVLVHFLFNAFNMILAGLSMV